MTRARPIRALFWKEWREQRWRLALSALVLTVLSASLVRAQLVTAAEAEVIVFGPLGLVLSIFMAMGPVPPEKSDGTWPFLCAQPVRQGELIAVKWATGALGLVAALLLAGGAAYVAAVSRGLFESQPMPVITTDAPNISGSWIHGEDTPLLLIKVVASACSAFVAFYSLLFVAMVRARNELHAGLAGMLLALLVIAWSFQYPLSLSESFVSNPLLRSILWYSSLLNPLSPLLFLAERTTVHHVVAVITAPALWIGVPVIYRRYRDRKGAL